MNFSWKLHIIIYACSDSVFIWKFNAIYVARKQMKEFERYGVFEIVSLSAWLYSLCEKVIIMNITALV